MKVQRGVVFFERRAFQKYIKNNELSFLESTMSNFDLINVRLHTKSTPKNRVKYKKNSYLEIFSIVLLLIKRLKNTYYMLKLFFVY